MGRQGYGCWSEGKTPQRSTNYLAPDQAEPLAIQRSQSVKECEESPEREHDAAESEAELEHTMRNSHHMMSLIDTLADPGGGQKGPGPPPFMPQKIKMKECTFQ